MMMLAQKSLQIIRRVSRLVLYFIYIHTIAIHLKLYAFRLLYACKLSVADDEICPLRNSIKAPIRPQYYSIRVLVTVMHP